MEENTYAAGDQVNTKSIDASEQTMSKFAELCISFKGSQVRWREYQNDCMNFMQQFVARFKDYLDIPPDKIKVQPPTETDHRVSLPVFAAARGTDDHYWEINLIIILSHLVDSLPHYPHKIRIRWKKDKDSFLVKFADNVEVKVVPRDSPLGIDDLCADLFALMKKYLDTEVEEAISDRPRRMGF